MKTYTVTLIVAWGLLIVAILATRHHHRDSMEMAYCIAEWSYTHPLKDKMLELAQGIQNCR